MSADGTTGWSFSRARARELVEFARRHGFGRDEVIQMIETLP